jgi:protease-4
MKFLSTLVANVLGTFIAIGIFVFVAFLFMIALVASTDSTPAVRSGTVLVLDVEGSVAERVSGDPTAQLFMGEAAYGMQDLIDGIERAAEDDRIAGLWIRPGMLTMDWSKLEATKRAIETFKASGKPVMASSSDYYVAEDAYYLMSTADRIFLDPQAMFEYNGFATQVFYLADLFERLEINPVVVRSGTYKAAVEPFLRTDLSPENREQMQAMVDAIQETFVQGVAVGRGMAPDVLDRMLVEDAMMSASDAFAAGLVDTLAYESDVRMAFQAALNADSTERLPTVSISRYARTLPAGLSTSGDIAVVHVSGTMVPGDASDTSPFGGGSLAAAGTVIDAVNDASRSSRTKAIVLRIDSPGGFAPAADAMLNAVRTLDSDVPVIVSMGNMAASGGYWLATGGDHIVAEATTITGSIGVFSMAFDLGDFLGETLGVDVDVVRTSPYADMLSGMREPTAAEIAILQRQADSTYDAFLALVAEARGMTIEEAHAVAQGRVWMGKDALEVGLVDELGGLDRAIAVAADRAGLDQETATVAHYPAPLSFFEQLSRSMGTTVRAVLSPTVELPEPLDSRLRDVRALSGLQGQTQALLPFRWSVN